MRFLACLVLLAALATADAGDVPGCSGLALCPSPTIDIGDREPRHGFVRAYVRCPWPLDTRRGSQEEASWQPASPRKRAYRLKCLSEHTRTTLSPSLLDAILSEPPTRTQLTELTIAVGMVAEISEGLFNRTPNLCRLAIRENCLDCVKKNSFLDLPNLQHLNLVGNYMSHIADGAFEHLPKLQELNLAMNKLQSVRAAWFRGLTSLKDLDLDKNPLLNISDMNSDDVPFINLPQLTVLRLGYSNLSVLYPDSFLNTTSLRELWFIKSVISDIQEGAFIGATRLRTLLMSGNALTTIRKGYFFGLSSVHSVDLCSNAITRIEEDGFMGLSGVYDLHLANNKLTFIREEWFNGLERLRTLFLSGNKIYAWEARTWSVELDNNPLRCTCALEFFRKRNLRDIIRDYDQLTCMYPAHLQHQAVSSVTMNMVICPRPAVVFDVGTDGSELSIQDDSGNTFIVKPSMARPTERYRNKTLLASRLFQEGQDVNLECQVYWEVAPLVRVTLPGGAAFSRAFELGDNPEVITATQPVEITITFTHTIKPEGFQYPFASRAVKHHVSYLGRTDVVLTLHNFTSELVGTYSCTAASAGKRKSAKLSVSLFNQTASNLAAAGWNSAAFPFDYVSPPEGKTFDSSDGTTDASIKRNTLGTGAQNNTGTKSQVKQDGNQQQVVVIAVGVFCAVVIGAAGFFVCWVKRKRAALNAKRSGTDGTSDQQTACAAQDNRASVIRPYMVHYFQGTPARPKRKEATETPFYEMTEERGANSKGERAKRGLSKLSSIREESMSGEGGKSSNNEPFYEMHGAEASNHYEMIPTDARQSGDDGQAGQDEPFYGMHGANTSPTPSSRMGDDAKEDQAIAPPTEWLTGYFDGGDDLIYAFIDDDAEREAPTVENVGTTSERTTLDTEDLQENDEARHPEDVIGAEKDFNLTETTLYETTGIDPVETVPKGLRGMDGEGDADNMTYTAIDDESESCTPVGPDGGNSGDATLKSQSLTEDCAKTNDNTDIVDTEHLYESTNETTEHSTSVIQPEQDQTRNNDDVKTVGMKRDDHSNGSHESLSKRREDKDSRNGLNYTTIDVDSDAEEAPGFENTRANPDGWNTEDGPPPDENLIDDDTIPDDDYGQNFENETTSYSTQSAEDTKEEVINIIRKKEDKNDGIDTQESVPATACERDSIANSVDHVASGDDSNRDEAPVPKWPNGEKIGDQESQNQTLTAEDATTKDDTRDNGRVYKNENEGKGDSQCSAQSALDNDDDETSIIQKKTDTYERMDQTKITNQVDSISDYVTPAMTDDDFDSEDALGEKTTDGQNTEEEMHQSSTSDATNHGDPDTADDENPYENDEEVKEHKTISSQLDQDMEEDDIKKGTDKSRETSSQSPRDNSNDYVTTPVRTDDVESDEASGRRYTWTKPEGWDALHGPLQTQTLTSEDPKADGDSDVVEAENIYENENEAKEQPIGVIPSDQGTTENEIDVLRKSYPKEGFTKTHTDCEDNAGTFQPNVDLGGDQAEGRRYTWTPPDGWNPEDGPRQKQDSPLKEVKPNDDPDTYDDEHLYENENEIREGPMTKLK